MHLLVYTGQVSGRLNDKSFLQVGVLYNLKSKVNITTVWQHWHMDNIKDEYSTFYAWTIWTRLTYGFMDRQCPFAFMNVLVHSFYISGLRCFRKRSFYEYCSGNKCTWQSQQIHRSITVTLWHIFKSSMDVFLMNERKILHDIVVLKTPSHIPNIKQVLLTHQQWK